jgi:hypothetical protein
MMRTRVRLIALRFRLFRATFVVAALALMLATANVCPTGQTTCHMSDMPSQAETADVCILACGVLLPVAALVAPEFIGTISSLPLPDKTTGVGLLPEPAFRPPRILA